MEMLNVQQLKFSASFVKYVTTSYKFCPYYFYKILKTSIEDWL